jgi:hypothetical protein
MTGKARVYAQADTASRNRGKRGMWQRGMKAACRVTSRGDGVAWTCSVPPSCCLGCAYQISTACFLLRTRLTGAVGFGQPRLRMAPGARWHGCGTHSPRGPAPREAILGCGQLRAGEPSSVWGRRPGPGGTKAMFRTAALGCDGWTRLGTRARRASGRRNRLSFGRRLPERVARGK